MIVDVRILEAGQFASHNRAMTSVRRMGVILGGLLAALCLGTAGPSWAQSGGVVQRIAAVVNDEVISIYDVENRIKLVMATSGLPDTPEVRDRLRQQTLRTLIDERLQLQEANRLNATASEKDINDAVGRIENANRMPHGALLKALTQDGIDSGALINQIKAGISWQKVVNRRLRPSLDVGQDEVDEVIQRINAEKGTTEYLLAEFFLAVETPDQEDEVHERLVQIIQQMTRGTSFASMAQQFSQAASASQGGDIGWVERGSLDPEVASVIDGLETNHATPPIRTPSGFYVYLLRDKRVLAAANPEDATVTLAQLVLPVEPDATPEDVEAQKNLAQTVRESVNGCDDLKRAASELQINATDPTPDIHIRDLNPAIRPAILNLKVGEASTPIQGSNGITLMMVCKRTDPPVNMPSREDIAESLTRQRLDLIARRYLSDLRRQAFIDVRT